MNPNDVSLPYEFFLALKMRHACVVCRRPRCRASLRVRVIVEVVFKHRQRRSDETNDTVGVSARAATVDFTQALLESFEGAQGVA